MASKKEAREAMAAKEAQVIELLLQGKPAAEIETALELWPGAVDTMREGGPFRAALTCERARADLARKDRLAALASKALDALERALEQDDVDPRLALAVLQLADKLPPAVDEGGNREGLDLMERGAVFARHGHY